MQLQPILMKRGDVEIVSIATERMEVSVSESRPIFELDAELEAALRGAHEFVFVDAEQCVEKLDRRHRSFANPHGSNLGRLNQLDAAAAIVQHVAQHRR